MPTENDKLNKDFWNEKWVNIDFSGIENPPKYSFSNYGRLRSFQSNEEGVIINGSKIQGYKSLNIRLKDKKSLNFYVHKLIADSFLKKPSELHKYVIHLDFDKLNNLAENLKFVTMAQMIEHNKINPANVNREAPKPNKNYKLTESKVRIIKKMLKSEKSRLKTIAKQFGITQTQLNRIKSGENWSQVKIED